MITFILPDKIRTMPLLDKNDSQSGKLFKLLRNLKGIKQDAAAKQLGVKQQAISKLENCKKISSKKFGEIVAAFNFTEEEIEMAKRFLSIQQG